MISNKIADMNFNVWLLILQTLIIKLIPYIDPYYNNLLLICESKYKTTYLYAGVGLEKLASSKAAKL